MGNTFILLSAGHGRRNITSTNLYSSHILGTDTTARTLDATLALLAIHEDFQQELYEEIMAVMPTEDAAVQSLSA